VESRHKCAKRATERRKKISRISPAGPSEVIESEYLAFPRSGEEGRDKLESLLKKMKVWEGVSTLSLSKLGKLVEGDEIAAKQSKQILRFAETEADCSVKLMKKISDE